MAHIIVYFLSKTSTRKTGDLNEDYALYFLCYSLLIRIAAKELLISCTMDTVKMLAFVLCLSQYLATYILFIMTTFTIT